MCVCVCVCVCEFVEQCKHLDKERFHFQVEVWRPNASHHPQWICGFSQVGSLVLVVHDVYVWIYTLNWVMSCNWLSYLLKPGMFVWFQGFVMWLGYSASSSGPPHGNNGWRFTVGLKYSLFVLFLMLSFISACSTSPPSGNQVDGLPLVAHLPAIHIGTCLGFLVLRGLCSHAPSVRFQLD